MNEKIDYKNTVNLLETPFPMRGDLAKREPKMLEKWYSENRYKKLRKLCADREKFILHDGPPYANGDLHLGHAVNKILKDIIIRNKTIYGFDAPFVPGWDCHGLPIELNVEKIIGKSKNNSTKQFHDECRKYANLQIEQQKKGFIRLGVLGDWDYPYLTMNYKTEADIVRALGEAYKNGFLLRGAKPVHWCIECASALAEAEVEYQNKKSPAIYVKFLLNDSYLEKIKKIFYIDENLLNPIYAVIWTTTPWTLPANQAICVGEEIEYSLIKVDNEYLIIANDLVESVLSNDKDASLKYELVAKQKGKLLEGLFFNHPFYERVVPIILGEHVATDTGTGLVHTAPAHGIEDYQVGLKYNLDLHNPVSEDGTFIKSTPIFAGLTVWQANPKVIEVLEDKKQLLAGHKLEHSYPHCWRHKTPLIFRTTEQWFIAMDRANKIANVSLRELAKEAIEKVKFIPETGKARLESMIATRPDWCISRQRNWGVPMVFFIHKETRELHPDSYSILQKVADLIETEGIDAWFNMELTAKSLEIDDAENYIKMKNTLDVWFDSGTTHFSVLEERIELKLPADLYLEGSDQHRGWFQTSLLSSCAITGQAPYKQLLTHGFTVDAKGRKMSKSLGNGVEPKEIINKYGADILRLWVSSADYANELSISDEILQRTVESYRRIRNTLRFLLANLADFTKENDRVKISELVEIDKYALIMLKEIQDKIVHQLYPNYQFHNIVQELVKFCSEDLGGFYLDILKDRLYTSKTNGHARRSAQTVLYYILESLLLMLSPILCFTADEAWEIFNKNDEDSTLYHSYPTIPEIKDALLISSKWVQVKNFREIVLKELENQRSLGTIGSSLQAELVINANDELFAILESLGSDLKFAYMVSNVILQHSESNAVTVLLSGKTKCERCWHYIETNENHICSRCISNVEGDGEERVYA